MGTLTHYLPAKDAHVYAEPSRTGRRDQEGLVFAFLGGARLHTYGTRAELLGLADAAGAAIRERCRWEHENRMHEVNPEPGCTDCDMEQATVLTRRSA